MDFPVMAYKHINVHTRHNVAQQGPHGGTVSVPRPTDDGVQPPNSSQVQAPPAQIPQTRTLGLHSPMLDAHFVLIVSPDTIDIW